MSSPLGALALHGVAKGDQLLRPVHRGLASPVTSEHNLGVHDEQPLKSRKRLRLEAVDEEGCCTLEGGIPLVELHGGTAEELGCRSLAVLTASQLRC